MSFNLDELVKIRAATAGLFSKRARVAISRTLAAHAQEILNAMLLPPSRRKEALLNLLNVFTRQRQIAVQNGATSYKDIEWASAAACESWLQAVLIDEDSEFEELYTIIADLIARSHKSKVPISSAALAARAVVWSHFEENRQHAELFKNAKVEIDRELAQSYVKAPISQEDRALIMLQALHFALYHEKAIRQHISSMEAYKTGLERSMRMNFGGQIADYMDDTPCLSSFPKN